MSLVLFSNCFQTFRPRTHLAAPVTKAVEHGRMPYIRGQSARLDQADAVRTRIASAAGSWMLGDHMQTATSCADPAIGAAFISLGVSELELARIDLDAGARAEDARERLAQCAPKSAPGLMAHESAHE